MPVGPTPNANPNPEGHPGMHDPAMLQAAQLLLPGDYQAPCKYRVLGAHRIFLY